MTDKTKWLEAARAIRWAKDHLVFDITAHHSYRNQSLRPSPPFPMPIREAARFIFGGGDDLPIHRDMETRRFPAPDCCERAARICESIAYDGEPVP